MLVMSDLQLLTGLSLLASGYSQLPCGLSAYHWEKVLYLAWFASITHLSCLTFLQSHLYHNKRKLWWRAPAMVAFMILLIIGLAPTARFWSGVHTRAKGDDEELLPGNYPSDYAICYFQGAMADEGSRLQLLTSTQYVVVSSLLLGRLRGYCSRKTLGLLHTMYLGTSSTKLLAQVNRALVYRPSLSVFLTVRTLLDFWSSMAFEVSVHVALPKGLK
jgi:hypothetical protein